MYFVRYRQLKPTPALCDVVAGEGRPVVKMRKGLTGRGIRTLARRGAFPDE